MGELRDQDVEHRAAEAHQRLDHVMLHGGLTEQARQLRGDGGQLSPADTSNAARSSEPAPARTNARMVCADSSVSDRLARSSMRPPAPAVSSYRAWIAASALTSDPQVRRLIEASDEWRHRILIAERTERIGGRIVERRVGQSRHDPFCHRRIANLDERLDRRKRQEEVAGLGEPRQCIHRRAGAKLSQRLDRMEADVAIGIVERSQQGVDDLRAGLQAECKRRLNPQVGLVRVQNSISVSAAFIPVSDSRRSALLRD